MLTALPWLWVIVTVLPLITGYTKNTHPKHVAQGEYENRDVYDQPVFPGVLVTQGQQDEQYYRDYEAVSNR